MKEWTEIITKLNKTEKISNVISILDEKHLKFSPYNVSGFNLILSPNKLKLLIKLCEFFEQEENNIVESLILNSDMINIKAFRNVYTELQISVGQSEDFLFKKYGYDCIESGEFIFVLDKKGLGIIFTDILNKKHTCVSYTSKILKDFLFLYDIIKC